jgi:hypothetical protein
MSLNLLVKCNDLSVFLCRNGFLSNKNLFFDIFLFDKLMNGLEFLKETINDVVDLRIEVHMPSFSSFESQGPRLDFLFEASFILFELG